MTRVVVLTHSAAPAGAERALHRLAEVWPVEDRLHVVFGEPGPVADAFERSGLAHSVVPIESSVVGLHRSAWWHSLVVLPAAVRYSWRLRRHLAELRPDVVVGASLKAVVYGRLAVVGWRRPFVWWVHDRLTKEYLGSTYFIWSWLVSRTVHAIVTNSQSTLSTIHHGDRPAFVSSPPIGEGPGLRKHDGRPPLKILSLGRLAPWKGQDLLIRAFASSFQDSEATLTIAGGPLFGEDDYARALHQLVDDLRITSRVRFTGHVDDTMTLLGEHDVLVHSPRIAEPFGMVVPEGMQAGLVVVAGSQGGPAEIVEDSLSGILVDANDSQAFNGAMMRVRAMSSSERAAMGLIAAARAERFQAPQIASDLAGWLAGIAAYGSGGRV